jgi:hypothetical protein
LFLQVLVYGTVMGGIGAMLPFTSREEVDFFNHLEMHMRQENAPLCGRDHMAFRSYYFPVKDVIDGDLCEQVHIPSLHNMHTMWSAPLVLMIERQSLCGEDGCGGAVSPSCPAR